MRIRPRVLVTRASGQASVLADLLRARDIDSILIPTIELTTPSTYIPLDTALAHLETFHWLLFTSANAVEAFHQRSGNLPRDPVLPTTGPGPTPNLAAIGPATARALRDIGREPTLIPPQAVAESLAAALLPHARQPDSSPTRFLLVRAEEARDILPETLRAAGADLTIAPAYRTIIPTSSVESLRQLFSTPGSAPDAIAFTSSSTATNFFALASAAAIELPPTTLLVSIGPITSATLRDLNHPSTVEAEEPSVDSLVEILVKTLQSNNSF